jgi:hypothetical protein
MSLTIGGLLPVLNDLTDLEHLAWHTESLRSMSVLQEGPIRRW